MKTITYVIGLIAIGAIISTHQILGLWTTFLGILMSIIVTLYFLNRFSFPSSDIYLSIRIGHVDSQKRNAIVTVSSNRSGHLVLSARGGMSTFHCKTEYVHAGRIKDIDISMPYLADEIIAELYCQSEEKQPLATAVEGMFENPLIE